MECPALVGGLCLCTPVSWRGGSGQALDATREEFLPKGLTTGGSLCWHYRHANPPRQCRELLEQPSNAHAMPA